MFGLTDLRVDTTLLTEMQLVTATVLIQRVDDWKNNRLLQEIKTTTYMTFVMVMRRAYFSIYNLVKVVLFVETPAMVKPNQNSRIYSYLHVMLMVVIATTCN
jgi:hypothetical protein